MAQLRYSLVLIPDHDHGGYTVEVPALPGVVTEGDTREEAVENAIEAIQLMLEDLAGDGEEIPEDLGPLEVVEVKVQGPQSESADLLTNFFKETLRAFSSDRVMKDRMGGPFVLRLAKSGIYPQTHEVFSLDSLAPLGVRIRSNTPISAEASITAASTIKALVAAAS